ncbi:MAG TPA: replicative DNA helicase [Pyrinomonadaceae bacterium]|jgi:replicative DNA helicase|nr:replicative DNA helicase [Pyrinomonadaceae bacterium]
MAKNFGADSSRDQMLERPLPHSADAERAILGAIILDNALVNQAIELMRADDFYVRAHYHVFRAMISMSERGAEINPILLGEELRREGVLEQVGGISFISELTYGLPHFTNVAAYAKVVREKSLMRQLVKVANKITSEALEEEDEAQLILDHAEQMIFALADERTRQGFSHVKPVADAILEKVQEMGGRGAVLTGLTTGFTEMDVMTSGLQPSDLIIVAARPSMGKTSFCLTLAQNAALQAGAVVGVFSLEMSKESLVMRMLCSEGHVDAHRFRNGFLSREEWGRMAGALGRLAETKIYIDDTPGISVLEMRAKARRLAAEQKRLDLIIVDYLQLMSGSSRRSESRQQEVSQISRELKGLAKELNVPLVALSQLSRAPEARTDHRPQLADLRECVAGDTLVMLADGSRVPAESLVGTQPEVLALSGEGRIVAARSDRVWAVGRRPVFDVHLASGRRVRATAKHRLRAWDDWKRVAELRQGDRVAVARRLPEPAQSLSWSEARLTLLGQMIGDGSYLTHQPMRYTTNSEENSRAVAAAARSEFGAEVKRYAGRRDWHQLLISGNGDRWKPAGVNLWLRELGVYGQRSHEKRVPEAAFRLGNTQIALLLRHLWATDGCIYTPPDGSRSSGKVYYGTNSEGLARDVAALLLRLGIVTRTYTVEQGRYRPAHHVAVSGAGDQRRFLAAVGAFGPRVAQAQKLAAYLASRQPNTNVDTLPQECFGEIKLKMSAQGMSQRAMAAARGTSYGGTSHFSFAPSRAVVNDYAALLGDDALAARADDDLFWDRVVAVEPAGEEEVFDLTVPGPASWLADGIVSHNSGAIEQDADIVMFIYREEQYNRTEENAGLAEIIVSKQRNGPTGTVKLAFLKEFTRFENMWRE